LLRVGGDSVLRSSLRAPGVPNWRLWRGQLVRRSTSGRPTLDHSGPLRAGSLFVALLPSDHGEADRSRSGGAMPPPPIEDPLVHKRGGERQRRPSPTSPSRSESGDAGVGTVELVELASPVDGRRGRTAKPGWCICTMTNKSRSCPCAWPARDRGGPTIIPQRARWAVWSTPSGPLTIHSRPSRTARVASDWQWSEPAPGSIEEWHQILFADVKQTAATTCFGSAGRGRRRWGRPCMAIEVV